MTASRRTAQHQQYVQGLSDDERRTYEGGARRARAARLGSVLGAGGSPVETGAGFVLGLLVWGWVALPFLKAGPSGGPKAVKDVLRAKFFNRGSDGSWLP